MITNIIIACIPSLLVGIVLAKLSKSEKKADAREADRDDREELILECINANFCVTKELVDCTLNHKPPNGELKEAYEYKQKVKHKLEDYMRRKAAK